MVLAKELKFCENVCIYKLNFCTTRAEKSFYLHTTWMVFLVKLIYGRNNSVSCFHS